MLQHFDNLDFFFIIVIIVVIVVATAVVRMRMRMDSDAITCYNSCSVSLFGRAMFERWRMTFVSLLFLFLLSGDSLILLDLDIINSFWVHYLAVLI